MKKLKGFIGKIAIVFCMVLIFGILGSSNVYADTSHVTWNPLDLSGVVLSNDNLTATGTDSHCQVRATEAKSSGKWYWEVKILAIPDATWDISIGTSNKESSLKTYTAVGGDNNSWGYVNNSNKLHSSHSAYGSQYTIGDIIGVALDLDNGTLGYYKNGVSQGIAYNGITGNITPAVSVWSTKSSIVANFGATPFKYTVPDGYKPYDDSGSSIVSTAISLNKTADALQVGQTDALTAIITPDSATNKTVTWKSSDESIVTVDSTGKVTAVKEGTATITVTTTDGSNLSASCTVTVGSQTPPVIQGIVLNVEPEKNKIKLNETVSANLTIDNIKDIAAEDVRIKYDSSKLQFLGMDQVDGIKLVKCDSSQPGELRLILASKGVANVVEAKKVLLKLNFKGIAAGDALVDVTKGRVSDGITMEKDLTDAECGQATITIDNEVLVDVNKDGQFTLLDLAIDGRHYSEDPSKLTQYNTDIVVNKAIDDDDLTKIGEYMLANPNYKF